MKLLPSGARELALPSTVLLAALLLGGGLIRITQDSAAQAQRQAQEQRKILQEAKTRYQKSGEEKEQILRYLPEYLALQRQGFIGTEPRFNWVDALRAANAETELFGTQYEIGPQEPYRAAEGSGLPPLNQSVMKLNAQLLHEEDLQRFFDALARQRVGLFSVRECGLERLGAGSGTGFQPHVGAECQVAWLTLGTAAEAKR